MADIEPVRPLVAAPHGRLPPQNLDAEQMVLAGVFQDNAALNVAAAQLTPEDFYREAHRKVFEAMLEVGNDGARIERLTVVDALERRGDLAAVGGSEFVADLDTIAPNVVNASIPLYTKIVHDKALARKVIEAAHATLRQGYDQPGDVAEFLQDTTARFATIEASRTRADKPRAFVSAPDFFAQCNAAVEYLLDPFLLKAAFVLVSAAPKSGKTFFVAWLATTLAAIGKRVLFVEEEGPREVLRERFAPFVGINPGAYRDTLHIAHRKGFRLDDKRSVDALVAEAKAMEAALIVLDPAIQLHGCAENETAEIALVIQAIQRIIAETGATVVLVHHTRKGESWNRSSTAEAQSSDVRGSGGWVAAADSAIQIKGVPTEERRPGEVRFYVENSDSRVEMFSRRMAVVRLAGGADAMTFVEPESAAFKQLRELLPHIPHLPDVITVDELRKAAGIGKEKVQAAVKAGLGKMIGRTTGKGGGIHRIGAARIADGPRQISDDGPHCQSALPGIDRSTEEK